MHCTAVAGGTGNGRLLTPATTSTAARNRTTRAISTDLRWAGRSSKIETFFFADFEKVRQQDPVNIEGVLSRRIWSVRETFLKAWIARRAGFSIPRSVSSVLATRAARVRNSATPASLIKFRKTRLILSDRTLLNLYPHANIANASVP